MSNRTYLNNNATPMVSVEVVEHPAILSLCEHLEKDGYKVEYLKWTARAGSTCASTWTCSRTRWPSSR
jgi:cysteine sulfinate desulfinase/cysteine desulfurase-like protein